MEWNCKGFVELSSMLCKYLCTGFAICHYERTFALFCEILFYMNASFVLWNKLLCCVDYWEKELTLGAMQIRDFWLNSHLSVVVVIITSQNPSEAIHRVKYLCPCLANVLWVFRDRWKQTLAIHIDGIGSSIKIYPVSLQKTLIFFNYSYVKVESNE